MVFKVELSPDIFNFPNLCNETIEIENFIHGLTKNLDALNELQEWEIRFKSLLSQGSHFGVFKSGSTYTSYPPMKKYTIFIPIPTNKEINWGVKEKDFVYKPKLDESKMDRLNIEISDFDSVSSYIVECSKKGIEHLLKKGISLKGVKIKL